MKTKQLRVVGFLTGVLLLAFGSVLVQKTNLGIAPLEALAFNLNQLSGISVGTLFSMLGVVMVVFQKAILQKEFELKKIIQLLFMVLYGLFVDLMVLYVFPSDLNVSTTMRLSLFGIGQVISFAGIGLFVASNMIIAPLESTCLAIGQRFKLQFRHARWIVESAYIGMALLLFVVADLSVANVGVGTLFILLVSGPSIEWFIHRFNTMYAKLEA